MPGMRSDEVDSIAAWLVNSGLAGSSETELLHGFCERCRKAGIDLSRAITIIDTLHPIYEGRAFRWRNDGVEESLIVEYKSTNEGEAAAKWRSSPFQHLLDTGGDEIRVRIGSGEPVSFSHLDVLRDEGQTDYIAFIHRFAGDGIIGEMDCVYSYWTTRHPDGFSDGDLSALRRLLPSLALALKCASLKRISETLVEVYLGKDAGRRVLNGHISRGVADKISAVLWFSDLRGYTRISDNAAPGEIIPLLNDYAEAVISAIHDAGGDVLKLIGDGVLAIFKADDPSDACRCALKAEASLRRHLKALDQRRAAEGMPRHVGVSRPAYRGGLLRQYRQQGAAGFHGGRAGGQRGQPDRLHVPLGRSRCRSSPPSSRPGRRSRNEPTSSRSAASPCAASGGRRTCSRSIPRHSDTHHGIIGSLSQVTSRGGDRAWLKHDEW